MLNLVHAKPIALTHRSYRRASKVCGKLLYLSIYNSLRKFEPEKKSKISSDEAIVHTNNFRNENELLSLINEAKSGLGIGITNKLLEDSSVINALICCFTCRKILFQWAEINAKELVVFDEILQVLGSSTLAEEKAHKPIDALYKYASKQLKNVRKELNERSSEEASNFIFGTLFPKKLSIRELSIVITLISCAFLVGSYLFTTICFKLLQSNVVGLKYYDFWQFALPHTYIHLLITLFVFCFLSLENQHAHLKKAYINEELGIAPKRNYIDDVLPYLFVVMVNIPLFTKLFGFDDGSWVYFILFDWVYSILFDLLIILMIVIRKLPYEHMFAQPYVINITFIVSILVVFNMGISGWMLSEELKEPTSTKWHYIFDNIKVASKDYSLVYEGDSSIVFYKRDIGEFLVKNARDMKSRVGNW